MGLSSRCLLFVRRSIHLNKRSAYSQAKAARQTKLIDASGVAMAVGLDLGEYGSYGPAPVVGKKDSLGSGLRFGDRRGRHYSRNRGDREHGVNDMAQLERAAAGERRSGRLQQHVAARAFAWQNS